MEETKILTIDELSELLKISRYCATKLCRDGKIKCIKVGKFWRIPYTSYLEYIGVSE